MLLLLNQNQVLIIKPFWLKITKQRTKPLQKVLTFLALPVTLQSPTLELECLSRQGFGTDPEGGRCHRAVQGMVLQGSLTEVMDLALLAPNKEAVENNIVKAGAIEFKHLKEKTQSQGHGLRHGAWPCSKKPSMSRPRTVTQSGWQGTSSNPTTQGGWSTRRWENLPRHQQSPKRNAGHAP